MSFSDLQGQSRAVGRLRRLLAGRRLPPALLFHGPAGVGKTMAAVEFARALNCEAQADDACGGCASCASAAKGLDLDLKKLDAAYQAGVLGEEPEKQQSIKIDAIRHLIKDMEMRSLSGRWKTAIVCDAHTLQVPAANALLKALEEPPPRALWILVTARREMLLPTILSRCHSFPFAALSGETVAAILAARGVPAREAAALADLSEGSPGRALALWERKLPDPAGWAADPLAPFKLADDLPRELHLSRPLVDDHLQRMAWHLRRAAAAGDAGASKARRAIDSIDQLRRRLRSNVDPRLTLQLAAMELQRAS